MLGTCVYEIHTNTPEIDLKMPNKLSLLKKKTTQLLVTLE